MVNPMVPRVSTIPSAAGFRWPIHSMKPPGYNRDMMGISFGDTMDVEGYHGMILTGGFLWRRTPRRKPRYHHFFSTLLGDIPVNEHVIYKLAGSSTVSTLW